MKVPAKNSDMYLELDKKISMTLETSINREESKEGATLNSGPRASYGGSNTLGQNDLFSIVQSIDTLEYNAFNLDKATNYNPLYFSLKFFYLKYDWKTEFGMEDSTISNYAYTLQRLYHVHNSYHNAIHAADIVQFLYYFIHACKGREIFNITKEMFLSIIIAAAGHDVDHPGHNNHFEMKTRSMLATIYNDKSVLENHHAATTFKIAKNDEANIFANLDLETYKSVREWVIDLIMATDMTQHFPNLNQLKAKQDAGETNLMGEDQKIGLKNLMHACDIGNPARPHEVALEWTFRILDEFFSQGDKERNANLEITMLCDRYTTNTSKSQIGFINFMVSPLFVCVTNMVPAGSKTLECLKNNKEYWESKIEYYEEELKKLVKRSEEK